MASVVVSARHQRESTRPFQGTVHPRLLSRPINTLVGGSVRSDVVLVLNIEAIRMREDWEAK